MPKLKPATQAARRDHILDAAHACIARGGFHATTIQDICREAAVSPGALYIYFDSKEALIAGLCERDRAELAQRLEKLGQARDFLKALEAIGETYFVDDPVEKQRFVVEMGVESTRNPRIAEIFLGVDKFCHQGFKDLFQRLADEGRIAPKIDIETLSEVFHVIGDGLFWRRAIMPGYDVRAVLPVLTEIIGSLVNPIDTPPTILDPKKPRKAEAQS